MKTTIQLSCLSALLLLFSAGAQAQGYTYMPENFEGAAWGKAGATVQSATGTWTTNKNVQSTEQAFEGSYSLKLSNKAGLTTPELKEGAGTLIYYAWDQNREANVEVSADNVNWTRVENYKVNTQSWVKHTVTINDASVRYVRISTTSNNQFYLDNVVVTRLDGTTADGEQLVTNLTIPYFTQDFEQTSQYPSSKEAAATETSFNVPGQGEWRYLNAYRATNEQYITDGSGHDLRMLKEVSYVISPVLTQGVVSVSFNEGRRSKALSVYTSTDEGQTWLKANEITTDTYNEVVINDRQVNRIKLANELTKGDVDVDNITITAYPEGTPATITTGEVSSVTSSSAQVSGTITSHGDRDLRRWGICWTVGSDEPTIDSNTVDATAEDFTLTLSGLKGGSLISYRAYVLSLAGVGYGEVKTFSTLDATAPIVETSDVRPDDEGTDEQNIYVYVGGTVTDFGGADVQQVGVVYSTEPSPTLDGPQVKGHLGGNSFVVNIPLAPEQTYYFRAYATNVAGTSYGQERTYTTGQIIIPDYAHRRYYVSPSGDDATGDGSEAKPFYNVQKAIDLVEAGDTIFMLAGTYQYTARLNAKAIGKKNSGMIALFAKGGRAVLDFSQMPLGDNNQGMRLTGSYWHLYGLDFAGAGDNGLLIERNKPSGGTYVDIRDNTAEGHDNIIEYCNFYRCQDTGLQMKNLAENNKVINCDSYFNADPDHGDADGFAVKISHGTGNYFFGCRAWNNSDDGWDGFIKTDGGFPDDITTTFEECWAFNNGYLEDGTLGKGNGNGFKLGSAYGRNNVVMNRCLAFQNYNKGFDQNHNTGSMILNNCTAYSTKDTSTKSRFTYRLDEAVAADHEIRLTNCVAISDGESDRNKSAYAPYSIEGEIVASELNCLPSDFKSVAFDQVTAPRDERGNLPEIDFMHIADGNTKLIDKGVEVIPYEGQSRATRGIYFTGSAPDLGCFETGTTTAIAAPKLIDDATARHLNVVSTVSGMLVVTLDGAQPDSQNTIQLFDATGRLVGQKRFTGATTTVALPKMNGVAVLRVSGSQGTQAMKLRLD